MATVNKNFRIKNGLVVEGSTATVNGQNVLTETGSDNYIINLIGGTATNANTPSTVVKRDANGDFAAGTVTADLIGSVTGNADTASALETARTIELTGDVTGSVSFDGTANVQISTTLDTDFATDVEVATAKGEAISDAATSVDSKIGDNTVNGTLGNTVTDRIATAKSEANSYTDGREIAITTAYQLYADQAETDANSYADSLIDDTSTTSSNVWSAYKTNSEIGVAVSNLVDSAPAMLDTLNELAAAIADNPSYATDMTAQLAAKQNTLTAGNGIDLVSDTISANLGTGLEHDISGQIQINRTTVDSWYDAAGLAASAQSDAEATAQAALDDVLDASTAFTAVNLNSVAKEVAATATISTAGTADAITWAAADYRTAKALVKFETSTHSQISEILLTLDSANNIAITDYAETGTNGSLGTISASYTSGTVAITVTTVNANTDVMVKATLIK